ncbi:MAG: GAF domain-containing protein [Terriglobales bacterium]
MQPLDTSLADRGLQPPPHSERRRRVRHKLHTPAYACVNPSAVQPLDLCEIVDINEAGMAIQAYSPLEVGHDETFSLDLPETGAFLQTAGHVIWSEPSGRTGIRFPQTVDEFLPTLKQWMFANAIAGWENVAPVVENAAAVEDPVPAPAEVHTAAGFEEYAAPAYSDYTAVLSGLAAVKREVESLGTDLDAVLQLVARRSLTFTQASGAAIAMTEAQDMICRASAGSDAPPLGARLQAGVGFSGECVRTGSLQRCDDSETDPRVDRESSRALGIRSMMAVPLHQGASVVGLLEVFSPEPATFGPSDEFVLQRLGDIVCAALERARLPQADLLQKISPAVDDEFPVETPADLPLPLPQLSRSRNLVLISAAVTVLFVIAWLVGPWDNKRAGVPIPLSSQVQLSPQDSLPGQPRAVSALSITGSTSGNSMESLRRLAEQGDSVAQFAMGARYATGEEVPIDYAEAARWFTKAAEQGNVAAQATLGTYFWAGRGVPPDPIKAYFWSLVAEADGDAASKDRAAAVASHLTHGQMLAVQQQAKQWAHQHPAAMQHLSVQ